VSTNLFVGAAANPICYSVKALSKEDCHVQEDDRSGVFLAPPANAAEGIHRRPA
jgi:hypothetical protein